MDKLERHYRKRPVIYTAPDFYRDNLTGEFKNYPFWLRSVAAHPSQVYPGRKWLFWQYRDQGSRTVSKAGSISMCSMAAKKTGITGRRAADGEPGRNSLIRYSEAQRPSSAVLLAVLPASAHGLRHAVGCGFHHRTQRRERSVGEPDSWPRYGNPGDCLAIFVEDRGG